mmetsp:Transcript_67263/g.217359  ORF Transcript_67263/g.217359 Transcript_67263/m.217359 type:complete len:92 (+) Transcript_67263:576-851(+)
MPKKEIGRLYHLEAHSMHCDCKLAGHKCRLFVNFTKIVKPKGAPPFKKVRLMRECLLMMYKFLAHGVQHDAQEHEQFASTLKDEWMAGFQC